jgi:Flp pilus assembly protein CpaB
MRKNGRLFIVLGVGLACLAVALAFLMFQNAGKSSAVEKAPVPVKIVVAAKDVPPHQVLRETDLSEETIDKDLLVGADFIGSRSEALGLAPKTGLVKGQRLKKVELEVSGLTNDIAPGKRAVTLNVDKLQTAGGLLRDSDYIDLIFSTKVNLTYIFPTRPYEVETATGGDGSSGQGQTVTLPAQSPSDPSAYVFPGEAGSRFKIQGEKKGDPLAKVILQDIKVLRVVVAAPPAQGQQQQQPQQAAQSDMLILEMSTDQAEVMKFILDNGASYSFAVRGKDDHTTAETKGITYDLFVTNYQLPMPKSVRLPGEKQP